MNANYSSYIIIFEACHLTLHYCGERQANDKLLGNQKLFIFWKGLVEGGEGRAEVEYPF